MADLSFRTQTPTHGESIPEKYTFEDEDFSTKLVVGDARRERRKNQSPSLSTQF